MQKQDIFSLHNKVVVVTGGTGVLGEAFVNGIAAAGGSVGILGCNEKVATERAGVGSVQAEFLSTKAYLPGLIIL